MSQSRRSCATGGSPKFGWFVNCPEGDLMDPDRFRLIEEIYQSALQHDPVERPRFLRDACAGDDALRREVESLFAFEPAAREFMETAPSMVGVTLSHYRIAEKLGSGGMGEVYKARDTRLDRNVAIKFVKEQFSARFGREARAISSINHPHVCTLYDVGPNYLVMELLEGETLSARLEEGKMPLEVALRYGAEIADALAAAHAKGLVHRDLKPGNVMITKSGVKVLDFGLAKTPEDETLTSNFPAMGTPAYMAPEQREGKKCDARTDIYAFGLLLHEAVTGKRVLADRPPTLSDIPQRPAHIIARCLEADPEERWQSAADLKRELIWALKTGPVPALQRRLPWIAAGSAVLLVLLAVWWTGHLTTPASFDSPLTQVQLSKPTVGRFFIFPPANSSFNAGAPPITAAIASISPDGTKLAFTATDSSGKHLLWV